MTFEELISLLRNAKCFEEIDNKRDDIADVIPIIKIMFNFDQQNHAHPYDLWEHCVRTALNLPRNIEDDMVYLAALLHDIGKPWCQCDGTKPDDKNKHYYGHPKKSMEIVRDEVIPTLEKNGIHLSEEDAKRLIYYVEYHDDRVSLRMKHLRRHLKMVSFEEFQKLMLLEVADAKAHVMLPIIEERVEICSQWAGEYGRVANREGVGHYEE